MEKIKISIIIPTHNHCIDLLEPCLSSLIRYTNLEKIEVIVVSNGSIDNTDEYVKSLGKPFKLISFKESLGFTKATNEGIKAAKGEYIIFLNNDTVLLQQEKNAWIEMLVKPFSFYDIRVGATGPLMSYCPHAERNFLIFFCICIKRNVLDIVGFLDEIFSPGGGEDSDWCIRAENLGYELVQVPGDILHSEKGMMIGSFPIWHQAEKTMLDKEHKEEWYKVIERNSKILEERYKLPDGYFYNDDIKEYRKLVEQVPDGGIICELGTWKGRSLCSVADIIKRKKLKVIAVDTFEGTIVEDAMIEVAKRENIEFIFIENMERFGLKPTIYRMTTNEASIRVKDKSLDLVFIDSDHTEEGVRNDLAKWESKVKKGGLISGHDYNGVTWPGVRKAVDERYYDVHYDGKSIVWSKKL